MFCFAREERETALCHMLSCLQNCPALSECRGTRAPLCKRSSGLESRDAMSSYNFGKTPPVDTRGNA